MSKEYQLHFFSNKSRNSVKKMIENHLSNKDSKQSQSNQTLPFIRRTWPCGRRTSPPESRRTMGRAGSLLQEGPKGASEGRLPARALLADRQGLASPPGGFILGIGCLLTDSMVTPSLSTHGHVSSVQHSGRKPPLSFSSMSETGEYRPHRPWVSSTLFNCSVTAEAINTPPATGSVTAPYAH